MLEECKKMQTNIKFNVSKKECMYFLLEHPKLYALQGL